jgi:hypothetical protein
MGLTLSLIWFLFFSNGIALCDLVCRMLKNFRLPCRMTLHPFQVRPRQERVHFKYVYQRCSYIVVVSDVVHRTTYEDLLKTHRILVFACAEIMKRPSTEADKPILDSSTLVTNLVPSTAKR